MQDAPRYKAFISYSHADTKWASWLHRALESYRTPRRLRAGGDALPDRLQPIFRDRDELASAPDLSETIRSALRQSENLIVICSPAAATSRWVNREVEEFKQLGRSNNIHCLIVDGDPQAPDVAEDCFVPALRQRHDQHGQRIDGVAEPIAADLRPQADGQKLARQKIIAGLLGVGLDTLVQREQQRRNRRLVALAGGSLVAALFAAGLAVNAMLARNEAELARGEAEQRREQAEELLGFMVGDLRENLEPIGRLDLLESVGQQAMAYFDTVDMAQLSDGELLRQSQVMTQLGEIRFAQLHYEDALDAFTEAYKRSAALYRNDPADSERLFNRSQAEFWVGYVAFSHGKLEDAREWMTRYRDSAQKLSAANPERRDWIREVAYSHHNLAVVEAEAGSPDTAAREFSLEIQMLDELLSTGADTELQISRADAYSWLGNIQRDQGQLLDALAYYRISTVEFRSLLASDENNAQFRESLGWALNREADMTTLLGRLEEASNLVAEVLEIFGSLAALDPDNTIWQLELSNMWLKRAYLLATSGEWMNSLELTDRTIAHFEKIRADKSDNHDLKVTLAKAYRLRGEIQKEQGSLVAATAAVHAGIDALKEVEQATGLSDSRLGGLASLYVLLGEIHDLQQQSVARDEAWLQAKQALQPRLSNGHSHYLLDPWTRLLLLTGRPLEAEAVRDKLTANHYRPLIAWPD